MRPARKICRLLLLSATPAHREPEDIDRHLSYVARGGKGTRCFETPEDREEHLRGIMLRRLRRFEGWTKYGYRREHLLPCDAEDVYDHLTLALVQKYVERLVDRNNNRFKIGFLSSFDSCAPSPRHEPR